MPSRLTNFLLAAIVNSPLHPVLGESFAVIAVRGRRSGKSIRTPVDVARDGDTLTIISKRERTWWRNLRSGQSAELRLGGRNLQVRGEVVEIAERVGEALAGYFAARPGYAKFFGVRLQPDGTPAPDDLRAAAAGRVVIHLHEVRSEPVDRARRTVRRRIFSADRREGKSPARARDRPNSAVDRGFIGLGPAVILCVTDPAGVG